LLNLQRHGIRQGAVGRVAAGVIQKRPKQLKKAYTGRGGRAPQKGRWRARIEIALTKLSGAPQGTTAAPRPAGTRKQNRNNTAAPVKRLNVTSLLDDCGEPVSVRPIQDEIRRARCQGLPVSGLYDPFEERRPLLS